MPKHKRYGSAPRPPSAKALKAMDRLYGGARKLGRQDEALKARLEREKDDEEREDRER